MSNGIVRSITVRLPLESVKVFRSMSFAISSNKLGSKFINYGRVLTAAIHKYCKRQEFAWQFCAKV